MGGSSSSRLQDLSGPECIGEVVPPPGMLRATYIDNSTIDKSSNMNNQGVKCSNNENGNLPPFPFEKIRVQKGKYVTVRKVFEKLQKGGFIPRTETVETVDIYIMIELFIGTPFFIKLRKDDHSGLSDFSTTFQDKKKSKDTIEGGIGGEVWRGWNIVFTKRTKEIMDWFFEWNKNVLIQYKDEKLSEETIRKMYFLSNIYSNIGDLSPSLYYVEAATPGKKNKSLVQLMWYFGLK